MCEYVYSEYIKRINEEAMKTNAKKTKTPMVANHNGAMVPQQNAEQQLERIVSCLMLFEDTFYEAGTDIANDIGKLLKSCRIEFVCDLAIKARTLLKLRHAPLFLMVQALKMEGTPEERNLIGETISQIIQRADELSEIIAIYWKMNPNASLPRQLKAGVAKAFPKFNEYNLAKYNRENAVTLRDAMFMTHPKPQNKDMKKLWEKLINDELDVPETWEVLLSAGKDKKKTFEKLLKDKKLGYLALLRNLRNMSQSGVDEKIVNAAIRVGAKESKALPFRFITAANYAPDYFDALDDGLVASMEDHPKLLGKTAILVDVSGSMVAKLSDKSELNRIDAATALAALIREVSNSVVYRFDDNAKEVPKSYRGLKLCKYVKGYAGGGTRIGHAINTVISENPNLDRIIIVTDEQSSDRIPNLPKGMKGYIIDVAPYKFALPTFDGIYTRFSGFSERVIEFIMAEESR